MRRLAVTVLIALSFIWFGACRSCMAQQIIGRPMLPLNSVSPPLDSVSGAWGGYSVTRKLRTAYAGKAFQVTDGSTTHDVGFVGNTVDTADLLSFAGANSCYITILYDQTANTRDLSQVPAATTDKFKIVNAGSLLVDAHSHPIARSNPSASVASFIQIKAAGSPALTGTNSTYFFVFNAINNVDNKIFCCLSSTASGNLGQSTTGGTKVRIRSNTILVGSSYSTGSQYLATSIFSFPGNDSIALNNGAATTGDAGSNTTGGPCVGYQAAVSAASFDFSEWIIFDNVVVSGGDTTTLQNNANSFYTLW